MIEWRESNGSYLAYKEGQYSGLVSQKPPGVYMAGKWSFVAYPVDGGIVSFAWFDTSDEAKAEFERIDAMKLTYIQMVDMATKQRGVEL